MASVKTIPRAVRYPHYPAPWCPEAILDAVLFQKLMKKQINGCHGIHREHYDIFWRPCAESLLRRFLIR